MLGGGGSKHVVTLRPSGEVRKVLLHRIKKGKPNGGMMFTITQARTSSMANSSMSPKTFDALRSPQRQESLDNDGGVRADLHSPKKATGRDTSGGPSGASQALVSFLQDLDLVKYAPALVARGCTTLQAIVLLDDDTLIAVIGMTKMEVRQLRSCALSLAAPATWSPKPASAKAAGGGSAVGTPPPLPPPPILLPQLAAAAGARDSPTTLGLSLPGLRGVASGGAPTVSNAESDSELELPNRKPNGGKPKKVSVEVSDGLKLEAGDGPHSERDGASSMGDAMGDEDPEEFRKELERLQIATIYSLVERVPTRSGGTMNMLFLTNGQATSFDFTDIDKVMNAMDIKPRPKLVVNIFKSQVHLAGTCYQDQAVDPAEMFSPHLHVGETNRSKLEETDRKLTMFLKEHLLPVCIKTHAIVFLGSNSCEVADAFGHICQAESQKRNGVLPFTVMAIVGGHSLANRAQHDESSRVREIRRGSRRWRQYNNKMIDIFGNPGCTNKEEAGDVPNGLTHLIFINSIDDEKQKMNYKPYKVFKTDLVARLSRDLPSIAFQTLGNGLDPISMYADYVGRNLPLVLIDTRPAPAKLDHAQLGHGSEHSTGKSAIQDLQQVYVKRAKEHLANIEEELAKASTWNFFIGTINNALMILPACLSLQFTLWCWCPGRLDRQLPSHANSRV
jgi:hypothetical protein